jgi:hypothetical protein
VKSFIDRPNPKPNIIKANTIGAIFVTISKVCSLYFKIISI